MKRITKDQLAGKIKEAENILIIASQSPNIDCLAGGIGLYNTLREQGKNILFVQRSTSPSEIDFLDASEVWQENAEPLRDFIISFDRKKVDKFKYSLNEETGQYDVLLTPAHRQSMTKDELEYHVGDFNVDLVIGLNIASTADIDDEISQHDKLIGVEAPAVNILPAADASDWDTDIWQEKINSVSEMLYDLCKEIIESSKSKSGSDLNQSRLIRKDKLALSSLSNKERIANSFLTGIVYVTEQFKNEQVISGTMHIAGELMELGADPALIADNLSGNYYGHEVEQSAEKESLNQSQSAEAPEQEEANIVKKKRSRRMYISQADLLKADENKKQKTKKEAKPVIDKIQIDDQGRVNILAEDDASPEPAVSSEVSSPAPAAAVAPESIQAAPEASFHQPVSPGVSSPAPAAAAAEPVLPPPLVNETPMNIQSAPVEAPVPTDAANINLSSPANVDPMDYVNALADGHPTENASTLDNYFAEQGAVAPAPQPVAANNQASPVETLNGFPSQPNATVNSPVPPPLPQAS